VCAGKVRVTSVAVPDRAWKLFNVHQHHELYLRPSLTVRYVQLLDEFYAMWQSEIVQIRQA
jgi:hypothetical protein